MGTCTLSLSLSLSLSRHGDNTPRARPNGRTTSRDIDDTNRQIVRRVLFASKTFGSFCTKQFRGDVDDIIIIIIIIIIINIIIVIVIARPQTLVRRRVSSLRERGELLEIQKRERVDSFRRFSGPEVLRGGE